MVQHKQQWEQAEIERSRFEAEHMPTVRLKANERNIARYMDPPLDTAFPLEYAYALLGDLRGRIVVDFGCGSGENSLLLARRGARVLGVDISEALLRLARRRLTANRGAQTAHFIAGSAHDLPICDKSVDVVLGIAILHHLDLRSTASEIKRILKPGGLAVFQEPVRDSRLVRGVRRLIPYRAPDVSPFERPLTTPELEMFADGFRIVAWRAFSLPFVNMAQVARPLKRLVPRAYMLDRAILRRLPGLHPFSSIRVVALEKAGADGCLTTGPVGSMPSRRGPLPASAWA